MINIDLLRGIYKEGKGLSVSILEVNRETWKLPSALFHIEYRWDKQKLYTEFCYSNRWWAK